MSKIMLTLDIARTLGWAEGPMGETPRFGVVKLSGPDATHTELFAKTLEWIALRLSAFRPDILVFEAPLAPVMKAGKTNVSTARILMGMPAIIEAVAYRMGVPTIREVKVQDVRQHFIGRRNLDRAAAKRATLDRCRQLGMDVSDDNAADAIAVHDYASAILRPGVAALTTPLFSPATPLAPRARTSKRRGDDNGPF